MKKTCVTLSAFLLSTIAPAQTGDQIWQQFRAANGLVRWPHSMPASADYTLFTKSADGKTYLLSNRKYVAMFYGPSAPVTSAQGFGGFVGLGDRTSGADFVRTSANETALSWQICVASAEVMEGNCEAEGGRWYESSDLAGSCSLENAAGTRLGACNSGVHDPTLVLVFMWSNVAGGLTIKQRWKLTDDGLFQQHELSGTASGGKTPVFMRSPIVTGLGRDRNQRTTKVIVPANNDGLEFDSLLNGNKAWSQFYPSHDFSMQFFGYTQANQALYVGVEDTDFGIKYFRIDQPTNPNTGGSFVGHSSTFNASTLLANPIKPTWWTKFKPLPATDGWIVLAKEYRKWVKTKQDFTPLSQRNDLQRTLRDGVFWNTPISWADATATILSSAADDVLRRFPGKKVGFHLYHWHLPGFAFGLGGPNGGFTLKTNAGTNSNGVPWGDWPAVVQRLESQGYPVVPYVHPNMGDFSDHPYASWTHFPAGHDDCFDVTATPQNRAGRACDPTDGYYDTLHRYIAKDPRGDLQTYPFNMVMEVSGNASKGAILSYMCPYTSFWKGKVREMWNSVRQLRSSGVYFDTFGATTSGCWDPAHQHVLGKGKFYVDHNNQLVSQLAPPKANDNVFTAAEFFSDAQRHVIDIYFNYFTYEPYAIPLVQAVFHDVEMMAGRPPDPTDSNLVFSFKMGESLIWGYQLGLFEHTAMFGTGGVKQNYTNMLLSAKSALKDYLSYGELMNVAQYGTSGTSDKVTMGNAAYPNCTTGCWKSGTWNLGAPKQAIKEPVIGAFWKAPNGSEALIYANVNPVASHTAYFKLPTQYAQRQLLDCKYDGTDCRAAIVINGTEVKITAPAHAVRFIQENSAPELSPGNPPELKPIGSRKVTVGKTLKLSIKAKDPDREDIIYSAAPLPVGALFNKGKFSWTPMAAQLSGSPYRVTFKVSDGVSSVSETIVITVTSK